MDNIVCSFQGERKIARAHETEAGGCSAAAPQGAERGRSPLRRTRGAAPEAPPRFSPARVGEVWGRPRVGEAPGRLRLEPGFPRRGEPRSPPRCACLCASTASRPPPRHSPPSPPPRVCVCLCVIFLGWLWAASQEALIRV